MRYSLLFVGTVGACFFLPQRYYPPYFKPINHLLNVTRAGIQMAWVYKFSQANIQEKHTQASGYLREGLRKSGGIYIKLGQLIATLDVIVPDEYRNSMMSLTRQCQQSSFQQVQQVIEQELQKPLYEVFAQFNPKPVSSASIGQVHRAKLKNGKEVAVKVQHANLAKNVEYDLKLMRCFVDLAKKIFEDFKYCWLIEEFDINIHKELNFIQQAENMEKVKEMLKQQKFKNVLVPQLLLPPTKRLLIMEFINGAHIDELDKIREKKINAKAMGKLFSQVIVKMIHKYGFVHGDPHSGNILVRKNLQGKDQLILLDHGLYQELNESTRKNYNSFWLGLILNDQKRYVEAANGLGTKNGALLCCMLTSQTREQLLSPTRNIYDLNPGTDKAVILKHATEWQDQIVQILNEINRQILLLLKVNEFARCIENTLGGRQMGVYEDIAINCVQNLEFSRFRKWKILWQMFWSKRK